MKLLFISDVPLYNPASGSEQVLHQQAVGMSREGLDVFAITRRNGNFATVKFRDVDGVKEACYGAAARNAFSFLFSIFKEPTKLYNNFIKQGSFFASICHQPFTCIPLLLSGKLKAIPLIYVFHSPNHEEYLLSEDNNNWFRKFPQAYVRKMVEGFCLRRSKKIMVLSRYMKKKAMDIHRIAADQMVVNPGGVDLDLFKPPENRKRLKRELGFSVDKIHLLTVRNLEPRMGLDNLLKAIRILKEKQVQIHLTICGDGIQKQKLKELLYKLQLDSTVKVLGFVRPDLLPKYYAAADLFILPTRHLEGFGLVTIESLACGTPVLGTPVGGTNEILSRFDPQFLFKDTSPEAMADGIRRAIKIYLTDANKYNKLRIGCREYAEKNYSWQRHIDQLKSVINELVARKERKN